MLPFAWDTTHENPRVMARRSLEISGLTYKEAKALISQPETEHQCSDINDTQLPENLCAFDRQKEIFVQKIRQ